MKLFDLFEEDDLTQTLEFKRWFANSKVTSPNGDPLIVYHGTASEFDKFRSDTDPVNRIVASTQYIDIPGIYFTSSTGTAATYASAAKRKLGGSRSRVIAAYLRIIKPLGITTDVKFGLKAGLSFGDAKRQALAKLDQTVHDGVIFKGNAYNPAEYIVFSSDQIWPIR